jgi:PAS domain S-box-containing protein
MFDPAALSLWERRAGYLSIALGRLRAEESLLRSSRRSRLLADTASELLRTPAPQRVVESVCIRVMEKLRCDLFFNFLLDEKAGKLHLNAFAGIPPEEARRIEWLERGVAVCGCVARDGVPVVVSDVQNTPDERTGLVRSYGIRAYACHPLLGLGGSVAGTLSFGTRNRNGFNEEDLSLMRRVTDLVSIAISRVQGEEALAAAMRRIEAHVDNSLLAVVEFDREFRIIRWSEGCERLFGWRADEVVGQTMLSVPWVHEEDRDRVVAESVGLLDGTKPRSLNVNRNYRKDGSVIHCEWYSSALYDHEGRLESILSEVADITERRRMEAELARHRERLEETVRERTDDLRRAKERLEREIEVRKAMEEEVLKAKKLEAVGVLAAGIAHDFNNALTAISNSVAAARLSLPPDGAASERLQVAEDAARNAKSLTQQLLTFSKGGDPVRKTLSIGRLAHETARFAVRGSNVRCA